MIHLLLLERGEAPRLSTFAWHDGSWHLLSHANFALPADAGAPHPADVTATARELVTRFITILKNKDKAGLADFLAAAFQIQRAEKEKTGSLGKIGVDAATKRYGASMQITSLTELDRVRDEARKLVTKRALVSAGASAVPLLIPDVLRLEPAGN